MNKFLFVFLTLCIFGQHVHSTTNLLSTNVKELNGDLHPKHRHLSEEGTLNLRIDGRGYFQYRLPITLTDASNDPSQKRRLYHTDCDTAGPCDETKYCSTTYNAGSTTAVCNDKINSGQPCGINTSGLDGSCKSNFCAHKWASSSYENSATCSGYDGTNLQTCTVDSDCESLQYKSNLFFYCHNNECKIKKDGGYVCDDNKECITNKCTADTSHSVTVKRCAAMLYDDQPCEEHVNCVSRLCSQDNCKRCDAAGDCPNTDEVCLNGVCTEKLFNGEFCHSTAGKVSGACRSGICVNDDAYNSWCEAPTCDSFTLQYDCNNQNNCHWISDSSTCMDGAEHTPAPAGDGTCDTDCSSCTTDSTCIASQDSCNWKATGSGPTDGSCAPSYHEAYADSPPPANAAGIGGLPDKGDGTNSVENTDDGDGDAKTISEVVYSRDGSMHVNKFGYLVDDNGFLLVSESRNTNDANAKFHIHIPSRADDIMVTPTGKIIAIELGGGTMTKVGQLKVVRFENAQGLNVRLKMKSNCAAADESGFALGNWCSGSDLDGKDHTYMSETEVSGPGIVGDPGDQGFGRILKSK